MPDDESGAAQAVAYLACPISHDDDETADRCIRRRFGLLLDDRAELVGLVRSAGAIEDGQHELTGAPLLRRDDVFGSKDWFVLDGDAVWYVQERAGIGYPRNVIVGDSRLPGWCVPAERAAGSLLAMVAAARALKSECHARGLAWQEVARRRP